MPTPVAVWVSSDDDTGTRASVRTAQRRPRVRRLQSATPGWAAFSPPGPN